MNNKNATNETYMKSRDYFLGESLKPTENVPDLLSENRKIAISLAESVMSMLDVIAQHFGVPTMELAMAALPEVSLQLPADGVREQAAARTYLDLKGAVPLADICRGTYAYPAPTLRCVAQEIQRRECRAQYAARDPLLQRIFGRINEAESGGDGENESHEDGDGEPGEGDASNDVTSQDNPSET